MSFVVKVPYQKGVAEFNGLSHGIQFIKGVSEPFESAELKDRLILKGYELVDSNKTLDISKMKKDELIAFANEKGIVVDEKESIDTIRKAIKEELKEGE